MSKEIKYNLPGYGFASCYLFDTANRVMELLDKHDLIEKTQATCQLGTMRFIYPGAHHTRYEYIFTQLMLINNVSLTKGSAQRNVELSLGSSVNEFDSFSFKATGSDIMQCLAILSNAGHMYDTFTTTKILVKLLQLSRTDGSQYYIIFKRNLPKELQTPFEEMLSTSNYYKLHLFHMIHILKGMAHTKEYEELCNFGIKILSLLINPDLIKNEATNRIFYLYKKIRKIAYLSVDMIYTPASFGANLNRMIYTIHTYVDDLFNDDSPMNQAIIQLEEIIHRQIYDSPKSILNTTRIEQESLNSYKSIISNVASVYDIRNLIKEFDSPYNNLHSKNQPKAMKNLLENSILCLMKDTENIEKSLIFDDIIIRSIPTTRIVFGSQISQNLKKTNFAFGLVSLESICQDSQTILKNVIQANLFNPLDRSELVKYAIKSLYKYSKFHFKLSSPNGFSINDCIFIGNGCKSVSKMVIEKFNENNVPDKDQLHEIKSCAIILEQISYTGLVVCFVGGIKASEYNSAKKIDELDGLIYFPTREINKPYAFIIEAKNYTNGATEAVKQLNSTVPYLSDCLKSEIKTLNRCAFLELSTKENT